MSCRVIGRGVEQAFLHSIGQKALQGAAEKLVGSYRPTRKNGFAADFYSKENFNTVTQSDTETVYEFNLKEKVIPLPEYVQLKISDER